MKKKNKKKKEIKTMEEVAKLTGMSSSFIDNGTGTKIVYMPNPLKK